MPHRNSKTPKPAKHPDRRPGLSSGHRRSVSTMATRTPAISAAGRGGHLHTPERRWRRLSPRASPRLLQPLAAHQGESGDDPRTSRPARTIEGEGRRSPALPPGRPSQRHGDQHPEDRQARDRLDRADTASTGPAQRGPPGDPEPRRGRTDRQRQWPWPPATRAACSKAAAQQFIVRVAPDGMPRAPAEQVLRAIGATGQATLEQGSWPAGPGGLSSASLVFRPGPSHCPPAHCAFCSRSAASSGLAGTCGGSRPRLVVQCRLRAPAVMEITRTILKLCVWSRSESLRTAWPNEFEVFEGIAHPLEPFAQGGVFFPHAGASSLGSIANQAACRNRIWAQAHRRQPLNNQDAGESCPNRREPARALATSAAWRAARIGGSAQGVARTLKGRLTVPASSCLSSGLEGLLFLCRAKTGAAQVEPPNWPRASIEITA